VLTVVDMGISNLSSVLEAFRRVGADVRVTARPDEVESAERLVLPGVGAFPDGMAALGERGLVEPIRRHALERGRPLFGICLGMQLLAEGSVEHGSTEGLGIVPGRVVRHEPRDPALRVPNMGWCDVPELGESFYFAHSYHLVPDDPGDVWATLDYGGPVVAAVRRGSASGVQFHPEKSQDAGLALLAELAAA
jgi:glutamine amidotransferase